MANASASFSQFDRKSASIHSFDTERTLTEIKNVYLPEKYTWLPVFMRSSNNPRNIFIKKRVQIWKSWNIIKMAQKPTLTPLGFCYRN